MSPTAFESVPRSTLATVVVGKGNVKVVVAGDSDVGKSALVKTLVEEYFPKVIPRTGCFEREQVSLVLPSGNKSNMDIVVVPGQDGYDGMRKEIYKAADLVIVCFTVADADMANPNDQVDGGCRVSFTNAVNRWIPAVQDAAPDAPIIRVGTKSDRRISAEEGGRPSVPFLHIEKVKEQFGALHYFEVSAERARDQGLHRMFARIAELANAHKHQKNKCIVM